VRRSGNDAQGHSRPQGVLHAGPSRSNPCIDYGVLSFFRGFFTLKMSFSGSNQAP
jgi:hypothetical protein